MNPDEKRDIARRLVLEAARGRLDRALFTDDASWWMLGRGALPIDDFVRMQSGLREQLLAGDGDMTIHGTTVEGDRAAVEAECTVPLRNGRIYHTHYHFLLRFRGDLLCEVKEYYDTAAAERAFQAPAPPTQEGT